MFLKKKAVHGVSGKLPMTLRTKLHFKTNIHKNRARYTLAKPILMDQFQFYRELLQTKERGHKSILLWSQSSLKQDQDRNTSIFNVTCHQKHSRSMQTQTTVMHRQ